MRWARLGRLRDHLSFLTLTGFAIVQPTLDVFGSSVDPFLTSGATSTDIVVFALIVAFVPALLCSIAYVGTGFISTGAQRACALGLQALLGALIVVGAFSLTGIAALLVGPAVAGVVAFLFSRFDAMRQFAVYASPSILLFLGFFLFASDAGDLAFGGSGPDAVSLEELTDTDQPTSGDGEAASDPNPATVEDPLPRFPNIVWVLLDELPTSTITNGDGNVDPIRYPNLASFADESTWYRNATAVNGSTSLVFPAIMSGLYPQEAPAPIWTNHPDNVFRLLGGAYHLAVAENITKLCSPSLCGDQIQTPPASTIDVATNTPEDTTTTTAEPDAPQPAAEPGSMSSRDGATGSLLGDAWRVWRQHVGLADDDPLFVGDEEDVVAIASTPTTSSAPPPATAVPATSLVDDDRETAVTFAPSEFDDDASELVREPARAAAQPTRFTEFMATIREPADPTFWFLHLVLPHRIYRFTETGERYAIPEDAEEYFELRWATDWIVAVNQQQQILQTQYTDALIGELLDELRAEGIYDDSYVVVMADHGGSFADGAFFRYYDETNADGLLWAPLFIKEPRQEAGRVDDTPLQSVDVLPTLADLLDVSIPWDVDGNSVVDIAPGSERTVVRFGSPIMGTGDEGRVEFPVPARFPEAIAPIFPAAAPDDRWATEGLYRTTPHASIVGRSVDEWELTTSVATAEVDRLGELFDPGDVPLGAVEGVLSGATSDYVAVALDGTIIGVSPVFDWEINGIDDMFIVLIPEELLGPVDRVEVFEIIDDADGVELSAVEVP